MSMFCRLQFVEEFDAGLSRRQTTGGWHRSSGFLNACQWQVSKPCWYIDLKAVGVSSKLPGELSFRSLGQQLACWFSMVSLEFHQAQVRGISSEAGMAKYVRSLQELLHALWGAEQDWLRSPFFQRICCAIEAGCGEDRLCCEGSSRKKAQKNSGAISIV